MNGRRKYSILIFVTICITVTIAMYGIVRYGSLKDKPDEKKEGPPIGQKTEQEDFREPSAEPPQTEPSPQPAPPPEPKPKPAPAPEPKPKPKPAKKVTPPNGSIGSYKTPLMDKDYGRTRNITLAAKKIDGYVVKPGESFSFNGVVGERTYQKGYMSAKVIVKGKFVDATGGGICQLSSTLYNAAQKAGLQILERHPHSKKVSYVKEGRDAAVDYGNLDLKFKNTMSYPVEIKTGVKYGEVYAFIIKVKPKTPVSP